ncbi:hypothetical protein BGLT_06462 [Caballeronia glathei]|jgi:hypothetical protein|uniref:Uncharacterized protein n=1 Tax=Caballeronia glathei TaxID=60547 RepID=A0A069PU86_9BURK|nr:MULTISPECIES: hypothetical protein [Burkholderiaceae]KDR44343.1 hypothetical protein BG61_19585 [Caballeronia glathei]TCK34578.1 hypothetical protein B0G84_6536 [Paraburkholderia sp. BL8N3]CDY77549.1 hypothetical protein BGLT_06462 [Caballeronia glathei]
MTLVAPLVLLCGAIAAGLVLALRFPHRADFCLSQIAMVGYVPPELVAHLFPPPPAHGDEADESGQQT